MRDALKDIKIGNPRGSYNCDGAERAFQGLLHTLQKIPKYGMIMLLTDTASKNLDLFDELVKLRDEKEAIIYVVLTPEYEERRSEDVFVGDDSWKKYKEISKGKMYDMDDYDRAKFLKEIVFSIKKECARPTTPSPPPPEPSVVGGGECSSKDVKRPIAFVIDTTSSIKKYKGSVKELTTTLVEEIIDSGVDIPEWMITQFVDYDCEDEDNGIEENTKIVIQTSDSEKMKETLEDIKIGNPSGADNCDKPERAFQGLLVTLQKIPKYGMIMLLTDTASKNHELYDELVKLRDEKEAIIYVVLTPEYEEIKKRKYSVFVGDDSWLKYKEISKGKLYDMAEYDRAAFLKEIVFSIKEECARPTTPSPGKYSSEEAKTICITTKECAEKKGDDKFVCDQTGHCIILACETDRECKGHRRVCEDKVCVEKGSKY